MTSETRAEAISVLLKEAIQRGVYLSGERLVELTIARTTGVSQNTVRDALRILEQEGWVVKHPRRGVYVRKFTREEAAEIFALLGAIEGLALSWAMGALSKAALADLSATLETARKYAYGGERQEAIETLFHFHEHLAEIAAKPMTAHMMLQLYNQVRLLEAVRQARAPRDPHELNAHIRRHESLYYYLEANDEQGAQRLLAEQFAAYSRMILEVLALSE